MEEDDKVSRMLAGLMQQMDGLAKTVEELKTRAPEKPKAEKPEDAASVASSGAGSFAKVGSPPAAAAGSGKK